MCVLLDHSHCYIVTDYPAKLPEGYQACVQHVKAIAEAKDYISTLLWPEMRPDQLTLTGNFRICPLYFKSIGPDADSSHYL